MQMCFNCLEWIKHWQTIRKNGKTNITVQKKCLQLRVWLFLISSNILLSCVVTVLQVFFHDIFYRRTLCTNNITMMWWYCFIPVYLAEKETGTSSIFMLHQGMPGCSWQVPIKRSLIHMDQPFTEPFHNFLKVYLHRL